MKLNAPKKSTFWIALLIAIIGVIVELAVLSPLGFWIVVAAFVLLALGTFVKGL